MTDIVERAPGGLFGQDFSGSSVVPTDTPTWSSSESYWVVAYTELMGSLYFSAAVGIGTLACCYTASGLLEVTVEALPTKPHERTGEALTSLRMIERAFGDSATDLARLLCVSRPMIYHYRQGMIPSPENFRRIKLIADLAEVVAARTQVSLESVLKSLQPEGKSLLDLMAQKTPDGALIRRILLRITEDLQKRQRVAQAVGYATPKDRQDIMRERHASGKPIYVAEPNHPGKIVQIRPDQTRVRGRMMNRVFVPDEE
jgi:hypothetical protein